MNEQELSLATIIEKYKILGQSLDASKEDLRHARNKLLLQFHPDKHPEGWQLDDVSLENRVHLVQSAYLYILKHYSAIQRAVKFLPESALTNQMGIKPKSHVAYSEVASYKKKP